MIRILLYTSFTLFLAACASSGNEVRKCGKGIYAVSAAPDHPYGNYLNTSRRVAFEKADEYCRSKDKLALIETLEEGLPTHIKFRCLEEGDPALEKSPYKPRRVTGNICE